MKTKIEAGLNLSGKLLAGALLVTAMFQRAQAQTVQQIETNSAYALSNIWASVATTSSTRGLAYSAISNQVLVANTGGSIAVYDGTAGTSIGSVSFSGVTTSGTQPLNQIGVAGDGVIYGGNLTTATATSNYRLYRWPSWNSPGQNVYTGDPAAGSTVDNGRIGDSMAVTGAGTNTLIVVGNQGKSTFVIFSTADGTNFSPTVVTNISISFGTGGLGLSFYTNNTFMVKPGSSTTISLVQFPATNFNGTAGVSGTVIATTTLPTQTSPNSSPSAMLSYNPATSLLGVSFLGTSGSSQSYYGQLYSFNFASGPVLLASTNYTAASNANLTGGAALGGGYLYALNSANNLQAFQVNVSAARIIPPSITTQPVGATAYPPYTLSVAVTGTAPFSYQWLATNAAVAGSFTNIAGANSLNYTISSVSTNYYEVIITNLAGSITSSVVLVTTLPAVVSTVVTQNWRVAVGTAGYSYLATDNNTRGLGYDTNRQRLVVSSVSGGAGLYILDANTGTNIGTLNVSGVNGGTYALDQVKIANDGVVYAGNLPSGTPGTGFTLYSWPAPTNGAAGSQAFVDSGSLGGGDRWGDTMDIRGAGINTEILLGSYGGTNVALLTTADGVNFSGVYITITNAPLGFAQNGIAFGAGDTLWAKANLGHLYQIAFDRVNLVGGVILDYPNPGKIPTYQVGVGIDPANNLMAGVDLADTPHDVRLYQLTGSADAPVLYDQAFFATANGNGNANVAIAMKYPKLFALDVNNGLVGLTYGTPPTTAPNVTIPPASQSTYTNNPSLTFGASVSGSLPLYYQWQFSTSSNGPFANISGANSGNYTLNYPGLNKAGYYQVVVHNVAGYATSAPPALLTVLVPTTSVVVTQLWTVPGGGSLAFLDASSYQTRGLAFDTNFGYVYVADHNNIHVLNLSNGSYISDLNVLGVFNGGYNSWLFDQIAVADDGTLYAGNLAISGTGYSIVTAPPGGSPRSYAYGGGAGGDPGSGSGDRWGDTMAVRGSGVNTEILIGSYSGTNVVLFTTTDGSTFTPNLIAVTNVPAGFSGQGIAFGDGDSFYTKSPGYLLRKVAFSRATWTAGASLVYSSMPSAFGGIGVDVPAGILGGVNFSDTPNDVQLYLLSGNTNPPALFEQAFFGSDNINSQDNAVTTLRTIQGAGYGLGLALDVNNGITAFSYGVPAAPGVVLTSVAYAPGNVTITWNNTFVGHSYQVQFKNNLLDATWTNLGSPVPTTGETASYSDTTASGASRFYRVITQ